MKNKIIISDITLRKLSSNSEVALSFNEKIQIVKQLDRLNIDVIELPAISEKNKKTDILFLHTVPSLVKNSVIACNCALCEESIEETYNAINGTEKSRLVISVPVSTVQMEYVCGKKPAKVLEMISALTAKAVSLCKDVEVAFLDSTRAEADFLWKAINAAISAGAESITLCDDAGNMLPGEFEAFICDVCKNVPATDKINLGIECSNKLHMATANVVSSLGKGVSAVKTVIGVVDGTHLSHLVSVLRDKADSLAITSDIELSRVEHAIHKIKLITNSKNGAPVTAFDGGTAAAPFSDISVSVTDDFKTVSDAVVKMGYELSDEDMKNVYNAVQKASSKKSVEAKELDSIIAGVAMQVPPTYKLKSYVINSGDIITPTANIELLKNGEPMRGFCIGDGPIDAAFLAIEKITGHHYELDEFRIESVTGGYEALGSTIVRLRHNGKLYSGSGVSTDIVGASICAYINALNKICFEEDAK